jgi:cell division protein FtsB
MLRRPTRLLALGGLLLAGFLYWQPLRSYVDAREVLAQREAEVAGLREEKRRLERRLRSVDRGETLIAEARRLGLVKPGERLVIVRGIDAWREQQAADR